MYNEAHALAQAMKESEEFRQYKYWHAVVMANEKHKEMVEDYRKRAMELQLAVLEGKEPDEEKREELQKLEGILTANSQIREFLQAEMRMATAFSDVQKILSDAIDLNEKA